MKRIARWPRPTGCGRWRQFTGDAGLLPIRQFDEQVGLTRAFADALDDRRDPERTEHTFPEMVRARAYSILAGHED